MLLQLIQNVRNFSSFRLTNEVTIEKKNEVSNRFSLNFNRTKANQFLGGVALATLFNTVDNGIDFGSLLKYFNITPLNHCFNLNHIHDVTQSTSELNAWKIMAASTIIYALIQELVFRGAMQDLLLKKLLGRAIKKVSLNHVSWVDTNQAKVFRIVTTTALFSILMLIANSSKANSPMDNKFVVISSLLNGVILGAIKESHLCLIGAIGFNVMYSAIHSGKVYLHCVSNKID